MATRDEIIAFIGEYLRVGEYQDGCHNGLQIEGSTEVSRIAMGVSSNLALIDAAVERGAEMIICHHGLFYGKGPLQITGVLRQRLHTVLTNDISLLGYHLPLDYHEEVGNNVGLLRALGCKKFEQRDGEWVGHFETPLTQQQLLEAVQKHVNPNVCAIFAGGQSITSIMCCTGAGARFANKAVEQGISAFITGEPKEDVIDFARESQLNFLAAGHYNTEVFGPRALGELLSKQFGIIVEFIDVPNPA